MDIDFGRRLDTWVYIGMAIFSLVLVVPLFFSYAAWMYTYGSVFILLTHLFVIPSILVLFGYLGDHWYNENGHGWWYIFVVLYSVVASLSYHISKLVDDRQEVINMYDSWDISSQNLLLTSTTILLIYDTGKEPTWLVYVPAVILAALIFIYGNVELFPSVKIFEVVACAIFIVLSVYILGTHTTTNKICCTMNRAYRDKDKLIAALVVALVAFLTFAIASWVPVSEYGIVHSLWHVYAYCLLYIILRSVKKHDENDSIEINKEVEFMPFTEFHDEDSFEEINLDEELLDVHHVLKL